MSVVSLRTQLKEDFLTCPICCDDFTKPKALPCVHTFCESCLRDFVCSRGYESLGVFPCPICQKECPLPPQGVEGFPDNHMMSSLSDTVENSDIRPVPKPRRSVGNTTGGVVHPNQQSNQMQVDQGTDIDNPHFSSGQHSTTNQMYRNMHQPFIPSAEAVHQTNRKRFDDIEGPDDFAIIEDRERNIGSSVDNSPPPPYSSVADTKVCSNDDDPGSTGWMVVPNKNDNPVAGSNIPPSNLPNIGWNVNNLPSHTDRRDHFPVAGPNIPSQSGLLYPTMPPTMVDNVHCSEHLMLRFGKQGSTQRDFIKPVTLAVNIEGHYIVFDCGGDFHRILIFNSGGEIERAFKCGTNVNDISVTKSNEIIASVNKGTSAFRRFTMTGQLKGEFGKFFTYEQPNGIAELSNGGVVLTGVMGHCVYLLNDQMKLSSQFGRKGNGDGYFIHPSFVAVNCKDNIVISDQVNNCVQVFSQDGRFKKRFGSTGNKRGQLQTPLGICVDSMNNIIVADSGNFRVEVFQPSGEWLYTIVKDTQLLGENVRPVSVAVTPTGKVAVLLCGPYFAEVRVYSSLHQQIAQETPGTCNMTSMSMFGLPLPNNLFKN